MVGALFHPKSNTVADWTGTVTVGNSTGGTQTIAATDLVRPSDWNSAHNVSYTLSGNTVGGSTGQGTNIVLQGTEGVSLSANGATIVIDGFLPATHSQGWPVGVPFPNNNRQVGQNTILVQPAQNMGYLTMDRAHLFVSVSQSTSSNSSYAIALTMEVGLYTRTGSTLSQYATGTGAVQWTVTSNNTTANQGGVREFTVGFSTSISDGDWWIAVRSSTATTNANWATISNMINALPPAWSGPLAVASNTSNRPAHGFGTFSATSSALPSSMAFTQLTASTGFAPHYLFFDFQKV